jgi:hypothetical protein
LATAREPLKTHQMVTIVPPTADGWVLKIRCVTTRSSQEQLGLYAKLNVFSELIKPKSLAKRWLVTTKRKIPCYHWLASLGCGSWTN